jgi:drug/metabolite transporter (DMT)-like permease
VAGRLGVVWGERDVKPIKIAFWSGLCCLLAGGALLAFAFTTGARQTDSAPAVYSVLTLLALLLASGGGFMALCTGPVLLATLLASPRADRKKG